jgi:hypothetical protein
MVCVIDPTSPNGVRMEAATFRVQQRDTVVVVGGQARPLRETLGNVMVARNAGWFMRGEPLVVRVDRENLRYLPYQSEMVMEPNRLVYLANVDGFPIYADRDEVADVIAALNTARAARPDADLGVIMAGNRQIRTTVEGISRLYVPLDPYGCTFQPLTRQDDVRKGK